MADELFELKNYFYLGNLSTAVTEGETVQVDDQKAQIERDVIMKRIDLARCNYDSIIQSVNEQSPPALHIVKMMARLLKGDLSKSDVSDTLQAQTTDEVAAASPCFLLMCAIVYAHLGDYDNALRTAHRVNGLDELAVKVQVLIQMDRADVAEKEVAAMHGIDEDNTLSQLATAWTHLANGGDHVQDALYIYQDLLERHGATDQILNGIAVCHLAMGKSDESERVLSEALTKNPNCSASLINVICSSAYRNKPAELVSRYFSQLTHVSQSNSWLLEYNRKAAEFDQLAQQMMVA